MSKLRILGGLATAVVCAGSASAADPLPVIAPALVTPVAVAVPSGPVRAIVLDSTAELYLGGTVAWHGNGAIDVRLPAGFGIRLDGDVYALRSGPGDGLIVGAIGSRLYRGFGDFTVGVVSTARFTQFFQPGPPWDLITNLGVGVDADYHSDAVELAFLVGAIFDNAGTAQIEFDEFRTALAATIRPGDRLEIDTIGVIQKAPGFDLDFQSDTEVRYRFGPVTPFVRVVSSLDPGGLSLSSSFGAEFEHRMGSGPLTLTGRTEIYFAALAYAGFETTLGFEHALGDGPLTLHGDFTTSGPGAWSLSIGISAKLGTGRLSGFLDPVFRL
ncbi:MAG: hypothetical protein ACWA6X_04005 [Bauldia sp.]